MYIEERSRDVERRLREHTAEDMLIFFFFVVYLFFLMILEKHQSFMVGERGKDGSNV